MTIRRLPWILTVALLVAASPVVAGDWNSETVVPFGNYADLAVDGAGRSHILFANCTSWNLCVPLDPGGSELTYGVRDGDDWVFERVAGDPSGSLAAMILDDDGAPHVAYCDSTGRMRYGRRDAGGWVLEGLYHGNPSRYRTSPHLTLDAAGEPHIAFIERETIWYAYRAGGVWAGEDVTGSSLDNWSARAAIAFDGDGVLHIGSWMYYQGGAFFTRGETGWTYESFGGVAGYNPWMVLDSGGHAHFVLHGSGVHYATNVGGDWAVETIDVLGANEDNDIALDASGRPFIAYTRSTLVSIDPIRYDLDLYLMWPDSNGWAFDLVDTARTVEDNRMSPRLEIDGSGTIHALYRYPSGGALRYATRPVPGAQDEDAPGRFSAVISNVVPNPFNAGTEVVFHVRSSGRVTLVVYDVTGRRVARLLDATMSPGEYRETWDGTTDTSERAPSGVYFFRLQTAGVDDTRRGVLAK